MKAYFIWLVFTLLLFVNACSTGQSKKDGFELAPSEFTKKLKEKPTALVLDVRSPEEFTGGALQNAINLDWNGPDFESAVAKFNKAQPIFVYCLSGGRSASAASQMRKSGFKQVYEMEGGLMKWRAAGIPMDNGSSTSAKAKGMQMPEFEALLNSDKTILVDFYADWCGPCKKMKPDLDRIAKERTSSLTVIRIDADANPDLVKQLEVAAVPTILIFRNQKETNRKEGFQTRAQMEDLL